MSFIKRFQSSLESIYSNPKDVHYVVAYSGGVDSHVLLHCCKELNLSVRAVHVHHGLQEVAADWVKHCQHICDVLAVQLDVVYVDANKKKGQSPEESARIARYQALQKSLSPDDCLLTGQHLNDQAETLLLQLFRTASSAGLAAMPLKRKLGDASHVRPLLGLSREEIEAFANKNNLKWVEDPSNEDAAYDRNFIRNEITPLLKNRWPEIAQQLSTVASLQSKNLQVLEDMAAIDLANAIKTIPQQIVCSRYNVISVISLAAIKKLSVARRSNLLRYWVINNVSTLDEKKSPTRNLLEEIEKTFIFSEPDANPAITFSKFEFRTFQDGLYLLKLKKLCENFDSKTVVHWAPDKAVVLPELNIRLSAVTVKGSGLKRDILHKQIEIRFRIGGEKFHPVGRGHSQNLKKLLQDANVPRWDRATIPLLYFNDELIAVVGLWVSQQFSVAAGESGWVVEVESF